MSIQAIVFDVDGTLADTEDGHRIAFNKAFQLSGLDWHWDVPLYHRLLAVTGGKERIRYFLSDFLPGFARPADFDGFVRQLHALKTEQYTAMVRGGQIPLRPGVKTLIETAHAAGIRLGIATTTAPENVAALPAADCIALEDSDNGLRASLAAGIRTYITVNDYTRGQRFEGAAAVLDDLSDLPAFCRMAGLPLPEGAA